MADDDTQTQTAPDYSGASPEVLRALLNQPAAAGASGGGSPVDLGSLAQQLLQQPTLPQPDTTPAEGGFRGLLGRIGNAAAGGPLTDVMSPAQRERAGIRALGDFGTSLMAGSGYYPGKPMFGGLAQGFQGAEQSERGSEQGAAATLAAQQQYQLEQQKAYLERVKAALPLLTLDQQSRQAAAARAAADGTAPGTAGGAGQPDATYESTIGGMEGTGKNPRSKSSGYGGFLDSTWQDFASANPDLFKGMTPAQVMAAKSDPGLGAKAITWLAQRNAGVLGSSNIAPTGQSLGIAHYVGPGPAAKIMAAPDNAPVSGFVSPQAVQANPELQTMTAGQMKQRYAGVPTPGFLKPAGGPAASAAPLPAPVQTAGPGAPTGGSTPAAPDTTPWDLPGSPAAPATPTPPTDTTTPPPPAQPAAPTHPDIPVPGGGVISHPGEFADYRARQFVPPTGEDFNPNLAPEQQAAFNTRAQALQLKQRQAETTLLPADVPKALIDVKAEQAALAAEQQNAIAAKKLAAATATTRYNEGQQKDIQTRYDAAALAYNTAAQGSLTSQSKIAEINATSDAQAAGKALQDINKSTDGAQDVSNQVQMVQQLSKAAGTPGFLAATWPTAAQALVRANLLAPAEVNQLGAQAGLDAATNRLIETMKGQAGFSRFTDRDLTFLQNTAPASFKPEQIREPMLAATLSAARRQVNYGHLVNSLHASGMPVWKAEQEADKQIGSIIAQTPSFNGDTTAQGQWITQKVAPGTFYMKPNGSLSIRPLSQPQQQPQQQ